MSNLSGRNCRNPVEEKKREKEKVAKGRLNIDYCWSWSMTVDVYGGLGILWILLLGMAVPRSCSG